jgi:hypothetical protein
LCGKETTIVRGLRELFDGDVRRGHVRVAESEVDHILACAAQFELDPLDLGKGVRRQRTDPAEPELGRSL